MRLSRVVFVALFALGARFAHALDVGGIQLGGGNLTSFQNQQGVVNNNQYNQMMNPTRAPGAVGGGPAADFGNCNALILRCASPKCGNGGCTDMNVAVPIVAGCVASENECKKHGDALVQAIAAQIVASNTVKANNAQNQAAQQQAAAAAAQQSAQMDQMNAQMAQMQQQMAAQQAESAAQMQAALTAQQQQTQALMEQQAAAAAAAQQQAASASMPAASSDVQSMADNGVSAELIARQQIVGQVMSSLDGVDASLNALKKTVQDVIEYAGCDYNATSCTGPKRVAAFKKKAQAFVDPYDNVLGALETSMMTAQSAGVDLSDIYMMISGTCNQWGKYLCDSPDDKPLQYCSRQIPYSDIKSDGKVVISLNPYSDIQCTSSRTDINKFQIANPSCRFTGMIQDKDEVQQNWLKQSDTTDQTNIKIACTSDGILSMGIFKRTAKKKQTSGIDVSILEHLVNYDGPKNVKKEDHKDTIGNYCWPFTIGDTEATIRQIRSGKFEFTDPDDMDGKCGEPPKQCFGMCSTHAYNVNKLNNDEIVGDLKKEMDEVIALKATIIAQLLKKNYDILNSTVKQIKTQLQKAVMTTAAEASGAASNRNSASSNDMVAGQTDCRNKDTADGTISCVRNNLNALQSMSNADYKKAYRPIELALKGIGIPIDWDEKCKEGGDSQKREDCVASIRGAIAKSQQPQRPSGQPMVMMGYQP